MDICEWGDDFCFLELDFISFAALAYILYGVTDTQATTASLYRSSPIGAD